MSPTDKTYRERVEALRNAWECRAIASEADAELAALRRRVAELEKALHEVLAAFYHGRIIPLESTYGYVMSTIETAEATLNSQEESGT